MKERKRKKKLLLPRAKAVRCARFASQSPKRRMMRGWLVGWLRDSFLSLSHQGRRKAQIPPLRMLYCIPPPTAPAKYRLRRAMNAERPYPVVVSGGGKAGQTGI